PRGESAGVAVARALTRDTRTSAARGLGVGPAEGQPSDGRRVARQLAPSPQPRPRARLETSGLCLCAIKPGMARPLEPIHAHAAENLRFIRDAMSRASEFTAVPGWGGVAMGATALVAAAISGPPDNSLRWILIWFADAAVAATIGLIAIARKARAS